MRMLREGRDPEAVEEAAGEGRRVFAFSSAEGCTQRSYCQGSGLKASARILSGASIGSSSTASLKLLRTHLSLFSFVHHPCSGR